MKKEKHLRISGADQVALILIQNPLARVFSDGDDAEKYYRSFCRRGIMRRCPRGGYALTNFGKYVRRLALKAAYS
jgi:hypothetical protein